MKEKDETYIARWLSGDLKEDQRKEFEQTEDFHLYQKIADSSAQLKTPDFNKQEAFEKLKAARHKQTRIRKITLTLSMAASIALLIFGAGILTLHESVTCGYGQQASVLLPDGSEVVLNAKSKLSYYKWNWNNKRSVKLEGEAFFSVQKSKAPFTVKSRQGSVEVLGTQFNVRDNDQFYEVSCYTGKVRTSTRLAQQILTKDMGLRQEGNNVSRFQVKATKPSWINGETSLDNVSLQQVLALLGEQYELTFIHDGIDLNQRFSGTFTNKDVDIALKTVFSTLDIEYQLNKSTVTLIK
ncbi:MAG: FecR domain-containing protein [Marinifilum sp.]|jgi:ferric-dicitrate binding protein FerR (iron transport regulator)|nr:FecR domain-containing protein [Marinifilum sp.]